MRTSTRRAWAGVVALLALAGCGGEGSGETDGATSDSDVAAGPEPTEPAAPAGCPHTELTFTNTEIGTIGTLTAAVATADYPGSPYLAYAADYAIEPDPWSFYPTVPAGGNAIVVQFATLSGDPGPVAAGTELEWGEPGPTFLVIHAIVDQRFETAAADATSGTVRLTEATPEALCFEIDYTDGTTEVSGTFAAEVTAR